MLGAIMFALAVGVGNNPHSVSAVRGADGGSRYAIPRRIIPARGQVAENGSHPETKQAWNVFHDHEARSKLANESKVFFPETRSRTVKASSSASE
jgi:hypothetical protein